MKTPIVKRPKDDLENEIVMGLILAARSVEIANASEVLLCQSSLVSLKV